MCVVNELKKLHLLHIVQNGGRLFGAGVGSGPPEFT